MSAEDLIQIYKKNNEKIYELRALLMEKLFALQAIDEETFENYPSFFQLLNKVSTDYIDNVYTIDVLGGAPLDDTHHFTTKEEIHNYVQNHSFSEMNLILLDKLLYYNKYLSYQLKHMGVNASIVNQTLTLKGLILLLDQIEIIKNTSISLQSTTLYLYYNNNLDITVYEAGTDHAIDFGEIELYEDGILKETFDLRKEIRYEPHVTPGMHLYTFKYKENNQYHGSELNVNINVQYASLNGVLDTTPNPGYTNDQYALDITITDAKGDSINQNIPFKIYFETTDYPVVNNGLTSRDGRVMYSDISIPYPSCMFTQNKEYAIEIFKELEEPNNNVLDKELSFIKNPKIQNNKLVYERVTYTKNHYLKALNGCVTDIYINNANNLVYTTFNTDNNAKIKDVNTSAIASLITDIFYKENTIYYETLTTNKYDYKGRVPVTTSLILETQIENDPIHANGTIKQEIEIKSYLEHDFILFDEYFNIDLTLKNLQYHTIQYYDLLNSTVVSDITITTNGDIEVTPIIITDSNDCKVNNVITSLSIDDNGDLIIQ